MKPISIGMNLPDRSLEKSPIERAITAVAMSVASNKDIAELASEPRLDITFSLCHNGDTPSFEGMRMGGFNDEDKTLYFEASVPESLNHSPKAKDYVAAVIEDTLDNADDYFREINITFNKESWKATLPAIVANANITLPIQH